MDDLPAEVNESQSRDLAWCGCPRTTRAIESCHRVWTLQKKKKPLFLSLDFTNVFFLGCLFHDTVGRGRCDFLSECGFWTLVPWTVICLWRMPSTRVDRALIVMHAHQSSMYKTWHSANPKL